MAIAAQLMQDELDSLLGDTGGDGLLTGDSTVIGAKLARAKDLVHTGLFPTVPEDFAPVSQFEHLYENDQVVWNVLQATRIAAFVASRVLGKQLLSEEKSADQLDVVSVLDKVCNDIIRFYCELKLPDHVQIFEENDVPIPELPTNGKYLTADGIDGSGPAKDGLRDGSAVMMSEGEMVNGKAVGRVASVFMPGLGKWFVAVKGKGAWLNGKKIELVNDESITLDQAKISINPYGDERFASALERLLEKKLKERLGDENVFDARVSSIEPLALLDPGLRANNRSRQVNLHMHQSNNIPSNPSGNVKQQPWDKDPMRLLMEEAGLKFVYIRTGEDIDIFKAEPMVVGPKGLVDELRAMLNDPEFDEPKAEFEMAA